MRKVLLLAGAALAGLAALALTGCQNPKFYSGEDVTLQLTSVAVVSKSLDQSYDSLVEILRQPQYSDAEKSTLKQAQGSVERVRTQFRKLSTQDTGKTFVVLTSDSTKTVYNELRSAYVQARGIVIAHRADFSSGDWEYLLELNAKAIELDKDVETIWKAKDNVDARWQAALQLAAKNAADMLRLAKESRH